MRRRAACTLRATFDNTDELLRPGMFVRVEVVLPEAKPVLAIPATAILSAPYGDSVYLIEPQTARRRDQSGRAAEIHPHRAARTAIL